VNNGKKLAEEYVEFDSSNVLFILGGAFVGIEQNVEKRLKKSTNMGFGAKIIDVSEREQLLHQLTASDIIDFGLIPELVGRVPIIITLDNLNESQLIQVLTGVKNSVIQQAVKLLKMDDIDLQFSHTYYEQVARLAIQQKLGARVVRGLVEQSLISVMFRAPELKKVGVVGVRFDKYPVSGDIKPTLIYHDHSEQIDSEYKLYYRGMNEKVE
jgi:ATP-dependent Clp protease ATP-binding subunit ClpX